MSRFLQLTLLLGLVASLNADFSAGSDDDDLQPGDSGKPVIVNPIPGVVENPWRLDDPDIVVDDDEPSDEDEGLVYTKRYFMAPWATPSSKAISN
jgi:hypothetical protein